ncbi:unannotated protein [freshwater metagenome]|uniref:Unannotated protein n=1 Tax=freshwater metagenome TaxID=449393 RepID=A0A6J6WQS7_9ZZZZ
MPVDEGLAAVADRAQPRSLDRIRLAERGETVRLYRTRITHLIRRTDLTLHGRLGGSANHLDDVAVVYELPVGDKSSPGFAHPQLLRQLYLDGRLGTIGFPDGVVAHHSPRRLDALLALHAVPGDGSPSARTGRLEGHHNAVHPARHRAHVVGRWGRRCEGLVRVRKASNQGGHHLDHPNRGTDWCLVDDPLRQTPRGIGILSAAPLRFGKRVYSGAGLYSLREKVLPVVLIELRQRWADYLH